MKIKTAITARILMVFVAGTILAISGPITSLGYVVGVIHIWLIEYIIKNTE